MQLGQWDEALAKVDPSSLLPRRTETHSYAITGPLHLIDSLHVASNLYLCIIKDQKGSIFSIPIILASERIRRVIAGDGLSEELTRFPIGTSIVGNFTINNTYNNLSSGERAIGVDQTEESIIVGKKTIIKYFSQISETFFTSLPKLQVLSAAGFKDMPSLLATIQWKFDGEQYLLALMTEYIPDSDDGWTWAVEMAQEFLDDERSLESATEFGFKLGKILAHMHEAFIANTHLQSDSKLHDQWVSSALSDLEVALSLLPGNEGDLLRSLIPAITAEFNKLGNILSQTLSWTHGDFHVGQILKTPSNDYLIIDFDGNPVADRNLQSTYQPLIQDLASLLQSIDHAARVVDQRIGVTRTPELEVWIRGAQENVLKSYEANTGISTDYSLLKLFQIQQEFREFVYAQRHLPVWLYVPQAAIAALLRDN
ncbi:MAG: phosphotransferase [Actinomycetes bacterium]